MGNSRHYNYKGRSSNSGHMTKSQRKREAYDYRSAYFRKNPGLFGCVWFCSQCGIPMLGKSNVQVDHIIPLAGLGINRTINTVAICPRCNREKSDKCGKYVVKGMFAKVLETILFTLQKVLLYTVVYVLRFLHAIVFGAFNLIKNVMETFGIDIKLVFVAIIILIVVFCN